MTRAVHAGGEIDINQDRQVGMDVLARDSVEIEDDTGIEAAAASLINQSGIGEAVAEDDVSLWKRWANHLLYILGATGEVKQQFGPRVEVPGVGIQENLSNLLSCFGPAGFYSLDHIAAEGSKVVGKKAKLGTFTAAIDPLERDEDSPFLHPENPIVPDSPGLRSGVPVAGRNEWRLPDRNGRNQATCGG
jgi:hypothetical protein